MGLTSFKRTEKYLCSLPLIFEYPNCPTECGCGSNKCGGTKAKGYGFKSSNICK